MVLWQFAAQTMPSVPKSIIAFKMILVLLVRFKSIVLFVVHLYIHLCRQGCTALLGSFLTPWTTHYKCNLKHVCEFYFIFFAPWIPSISRNLFPLHNLLLKSLRESNIFHKHPHIYIFLKSSFQTIFDDSQKDTIFSSTISNFSKQAHSSEYKKNFLVSFRIRVIKFIFCIWIAIFPANIVEATVRAMFTPDNWQGVKGNSF